MVGRAPLNKYGGENTSRSVMPSPPSVITRPSGRSMAAEWYSRGADALASMVQVSVAGFHNSAAKTGVPALLCPGPYVPPVTSTVPSGNSVLLRWRRGMLMDATERHDGVSAFRSMTSAVAVGGSAPPATRILPSAYIA